MNKKEEHIIRHTILSRLGHWLMAILILILLATGILPIMGVKFEWIKPHWIAGFTVSVVMILHLVRSLSPKKIKSMWISIQDVRDFLSSNPVKGGKYSLEQKLMHHGVTFFSLISLATGWLMMQKIETPFFERNPFIYQADTWGIIYVLHGLATLFFVILIMLHIYFSLRPEKRLYFRSMIKGWITRQEYNENYDQTKWQITKNNNKENQ